MNIRLLVAMAAMALAGCDGTQSRIQTNSPSYRYGQRLALCDRYAATADVELCRDQTRREYHEALRVSPGYASPAPTYAAPSDPYAEEAGELRREQRQQMYLDMMATGLGLMAHPYGQPVQKVYVYPGP
jgi:hypothetical protein